MVKRYSQWDGRAWKLSDTDFRNSLPTAYTTEIEAGKSLTHQNKPLASLPTPQELVTDDLGATSNLYQSLKGFPFQKGASVLMHSAWYEEMRELKLCTYA